MVSVVVPFHNEKACLPALLEALQSALHGTDHEIIFVDDGSTDGGQALVADRVRQDPCLRLIRLSRNFGQTAALAAGLDGAKGEFIVTIDADGQNDPADIPALLQALQEGADVACGWRKHRQDAWLTRLLPSRIANRIITRMTGVALHDHGCTLKAFRRSAIEGLRLYGEMHRLIPVWCAWRGARIREVQVRHHPRTGGRSHYGLGRTFKVFLDLLTAKFFFSFLSSPSHALGGAGLILWGGGLASAALAIVDKWGWDRWPAFRIPLMLLSVFLGLLGAQFIALGLLAEILVRVYYENRNEKPYRVSRDL